VVDDEGYVSVRGALAVVRCTVHAALPAGDHDLVIGAVAGFHADDAEPLVYHRGTFRSLGDPISPQRRTEERQ
jgi:flavin reductase (DIM6/NTAB) family NADH-FMN oxidoreductase RutF